MHKSVKSAVGLAFGIALQQACALGVLLPAAPDAPFLECVINDIRAEFRPLSNEATYISHGVCVTKYTATSTNTKRGESTFGAIDNAASGARFSWTGKGRYDGRSGMVREELVAPPPTVDEKAPLGRPYGRYLLDMRCSKDPWIDPLNAKCESPRTTYTGNLGDAQRDLQFSGRPFTAGVSPAQGAALRDQYRQAMANASVQSASTTSRAGAVATSPVAGALSSPAALAGRTTVERAPSTMVPVADPPTPATSATTPTGGAGGVKQGGSSISGATTLNAARASGSTVSSPVATASAATPVPPTPSTGTVDAAQRLQQALEWQRQQHSAQASPPAGSAAPAAGAAAPAAPAGPAPSATVPKASPAAATELPAPRIVSPTFDGKVVQGGRFHVQAQPQPGTERGMAEVEIRPAPGSGAAPGKSARRFSAPMEQLARGMPVPADALPAAPGRWQVRARMIGGAEGAWSTAVPFELVAAARPLAQTTGALDRQGLNPQPLPPRAQPEAGIKALEQRGLNPQPLPPREAPAASLLKRDNTTDMQRGLGGTLQNRMQP